MSIPPIAPRPSPAQPPVAAAPRPAGSAAPNGATAAAQRTLQRAAPQTIPPSRSLARLLASNVHPAVQRFLITENRQRLRGVSHNQQESIRSLTSQIQRLGEQSVSLKEKAASWKRDAARCETAAEEARSIIGRVSRALEITLAEIEECEKALASLNRPQPSAAAAAAAPPQLIESEGARAAAAPRHSPLKRPREEVAGSAQAMPTVKKDHDLGLLFETLTSDSPVYYNGERATVLSFDRGHFKIRTYQGQELDVPETFLSYVPKGGEICLIRELPEVDPSQRYYLAKIVGVEEGPTPGRNSFTVTFDWVEYEERVERRTLSGLDTVIPLTEDRSFLKRLQQESLTDDTGHKGTAYFLAEPQEGKRSRA